MDILDAIVIQLPCSACGSRYELALKQVLLSQNMLHEGCPVEVPTECPPSAYADLVKRELIEQIQRTWVELEENARAAGGCLLLLRGPGS